MCICVCIHTHTYNIEYIHTVHALAYIVFPQCVYIMYIPLIMLAIIAPTPTHSDAKIPEGTHHTLTFK